MHGVPGALPTKRGPPFRPSNDTNCAGGMGATIEVLYTGRVFGQHTAVHVSAHVCDFVIRRSGPIVISFWCTAALREWPSMGGDELVS